MFIFRALILKMGHDQRDTLKECWSRDPTCPSIPVSCDVTDFFTSSGSYISKTMKMHKPQHTTAQHNITTCVENIALRHFTAGRPLYVSTPRDEFEDTRHTRHLKTIAPHHSYIIFLWSRQGDGTYDNIQEQLELTK
jgi:hypothetical protein